MAEGIDIQVEIQPVPFDDMAQTAPSESSEAIRQRVIAARAVQQQRYSGEKGVYCNAQMNSRLLHKYAWPDTQGLSKLKECMERFNMSARAFDRILRVARTIADLDGSVRVESRHIAEAISYRTLDRGTHTSAY